MAYDLTALTPWVEEQTSTLIVKAVLTAKTVDRIKSKGNVLLGVKGPVALPEMDTNVIFQDGKPCGFTPQGTTTFSEREIDAKLVKVEEQFCPRDVEDFVLRQRLTAGSEQEDIIFHQEYVALKLAKIAAAIEKLVWQGDTAAADVNLKRINGFIKIIDSSSDKINGNPTNIVSITKATVIEAVDGVYEMLTPEMLEQDDVVIAADPVIIKRYVQALKDLGVVYEFPLDAAADDVQIYGTNIRMHSTPGLLNTSKMFAFSWSNMYYATDLQGESEELDMWYSKDDDLVKFRCRFRIGVQVGDTSQVVEFTPFD